MEAWSGWSTPLKGGRRPLSSLDSSEGGGPPPHLISGTAKMMDFGPARSAGMKTFIPKLTRNADISWCKAQKESLIFGGFLGTPPPDVRPGSLL